VHREQRVLVLGGTGFLGSYFVRSLGKRAVVHTTKTFNSFHAANFQQLVFQKNRVDEVRVFLEKQNCGTIINCIALADIEKCEKDQSLAYWINQDLPGFLSANSKSLESKFVHISTDAVFDGSSSFRTEQDNPSPLSIYGKSKWGGEQLVLANNPDSLVARVNFFGQSSNKTSLFNFFYDNFLSSRSVTGFTDVFFTPLYAIDLINAITQLLDLKTKGLIHVVGNERISKFDFGALITEIFEIPTIYLKKGKMIGANGVTNRSSDLSLSNDKIKSLGVNLPSVREGLAILKKDIDNRRRLP
jgi:dTDP-4-dehydrorhamnose reductase